MVWRGDLSAVRRQLDRCGRIDHRRNPYRPTDRFDGQVVDRSAKEFLVGLREFGTEELSSHVVEGGIASRTGISQP